MPPFGLIASKFENRLISIDFACKFMSAPLIVVIVLVFIFRVSASKLILVDLVARELSLNEVPYMFIIPVNWFGAML